jgi:hypothetical protein
LSFATFSSAYRFFYIPEDSNLMRFSTLLLLLCVMCVPSNFIFFFWHGYVLHEGITYKSRVPRTSQMTSRLLRHHSGNWRGDTASEPAQWIADRVFLHAGRLRGV